MNEVQTTEATGKKWKAVQLLGGLAMFAGLGLVILGMAFDNVAVTPWAVLAGVLVGALGLLALIYGKIAAWWYHA